MIHKIKKYKYILFIIIYIILNILLLNSVHATTQTVSNDINKIDDKKYPGIKSMIQTLQTEHPNWKFEILYTGLNWDEVIANEYVGHNASPRNLVTSSHTGEWRCPICGETAYDNGTWKCASEIAIKYMMDPRNSLNGQDLFQFLELTYTECTYENIKTMVTGTFLDNDSYINTILKFSKENNVSTYYIVALILQEQGLKGSTTISGTYEGYEGYYNIFNINASGNGSDTIIRNALSYAKSQGWDSIEKAIEGGIKKIVASYISRGQNTLYLQKFDVDNSDGNLYWHQYQQNLLAAQNEGVKIRKTFENINAIEKEYTFLIPVYENMPSQISKAPNSLGQIDTVSTDIVKVNVNSALKLKSAPDGELITYLYANEIITRLEKATEKINGTYWDKVMKSNGTVGYAARETYDTETEYKLYLVPVTTEEPTDNPSGGNYNQTEGPEKNETIVDLITTDIKIETKAKTITMLPGTTVQDLIKEIGFEVTVKDSNGNIVGATVTPGTGCIVNDEFTIVVIGDSNGDGKINSGDLFAVQKYLINNTTDISNFIKSAMDVNKDGKINSGDLFNIQKFLLGKTNFNIN